MIWYIYNLFSVCAFPYVLAFTQDTIEIRLIINGNLVHTMTMPELGLITSKVGFDSEAEIWKKNRKNKVQGNRDKKTYNGLQNTVHYTYNQRPSTKNYEKAGWT
jgi:hypothetical protein